MISKLKFVETFILLICLLSSNVFSQSIMKLEIEFSNLSIDYERQIKKLDSLNLVYENKISQIENEKNKKEPDRSKVEKIMSSAYALSKEIDVLKMNAGNLKTGLDKKKESLFILYSNAIDSLENIKSKSTAGIQNEILLYKEKRLLVSPRIPSLNFNPEKIISLDLKKSRSKEEEALFREYLAKAAAEVDEVYADVNTVIDEISKIVKLEKKTRKFIDETNFDSHINTGISNRSYGAAAGEDFTNLDPNAVRNEMSQQFESYNFLLTQLRSIKVTDFDPGDLSKFIDSKRGVSLEQYLQILQEIKEGLADYRLILNKKSGVR